MLKLDIEIILWFIKNSKVSGIFNVGTGEPRTFLDLSKALFNSLKIPEKIEYVDLPKKLTNIYQYFLTSYLIKKIFFLLVLILLIKN